MAKAKKRAKSRKHRSPAQKAATRKMLAANRARRGGSTTKKGHKRASAKRTKRTKGHSNAALAARVTRLETFEHKQKQLNTVFRDAIGTAYQHIGIAGPSHLRRLGSGH